MENLLNPNEGNSPAIFIHMKVFRFVSLTFVILAILGAITRTYIRVSKGQRRILDDFVLLPFACVCLIVSWILLYFGAPIFYHIFSVAYMMEHEPDEQIRAVESLEVVKYVIRAQPWYDSFAAINWASIFAVKFCYLYFFRSLIDRQGLVVTYWRMALAFTVVAGFFEMFATLISCPHIGVESGICATPRLVARARCVVITTIVVDIITDLMIIAIPVYLMYKVQLRLPQKFGICFFLCLSTVMVVIALVRVSRIHNSDFSVWAVFWQQIEACVAVLMISLTAFRTLFVTKRQPVAYSGRQSPPAQGQGQMHGREPEISTMESQQGMKFLTMWSSNDESRASRGEESSLEAVEEVHVQPEKCAGYAC